MPIAILRNATLIFCLAFAASALGQNTATLQQGLNGYTATIDSWICACASGAENYGTNDSFVVVDNHSAVVRFAIFEAEGGQVPGNATIVLATLSLYKFSGPDAVMKASRLKKSWNESEVTWNVAATGTSWETAGALGASDVEATADGEASVGAGTGCSDQDGGPACWLNIDVTSGVQAFRNGTSNHGWRIGQVSSSLPGTHKNFVSRENTGFPSLRPRLTIVYHVPPPSCNSGTSRPYDGLPISGPISIAATGATTFEAEHFNCGGEDVAYHDSIAGNAGGQLRTTEDVDIIVSTDSAGGGHVVNDFATGEWLSYTINVDQAGIYDLAIRASNSGATATFYMEIDGSNVTGNVSVPATGTLNDFQWFTKPGVELAVGQPVLKLFAGQQYFNVNQLRVTRVSAPTAFPSPLPASGYVVPTFHSMSIYFNPVTPPGEGEQIFVRYRRAGANPANPGVWKQGYPLWYDARGAMAGWGTLPYSDGKGVSYSARGSVVYLQPGTEYVFEVANGSNYADPQIWTAAAGARHIPGEDPNGGVGPNQDPMPSTWSTWPDTVAQKGPTTNIPGMLPDSPRTTRYDIVANANPDLHMGGSASDGYKVYDGQNNKIELLAVTDQPYCIHIAVSYVVVRRVKCSGAYSRGIEIAEGVTNVIIEDSEISDWGHSTCCSSSSWGQRGADQRGGVHLHGHNSRIVIQRNKIYDPKYGADPWPGHPEGPTGIMIWHGGRQNVIRYNEIYSTNPDTGVQPAPTKRKWFHDAIMGSNNFSDKGAPGSDSDVYHNNIRNVMDDGIELEGGGLNVRVWGNYIDHAAGGAIATSAAHLGPIYVFRNVINRMRKFHMTAQPDDDQWSRGYAFKAYGRGSDNCGTTWWGGGRQYFFNNTVLQQLKADYIPQQTWADLGASHSISGGGDLSDPCPDGLGQGLRQTWSRNNILDVFRSGADSVRLGNQSEATNNFDYDLYFGNVPSGTQANGVVGKPTFKLGNQVWRAFPRFSSPSVPNEQPDAIFGEGHGVGTGDFQLGQGSLGFNVGTPLPNFTFDIDNLPLARKSGVEVGTTPDIGAHEGNAAGPMWFGVKTCEAPNVCQD